MSVIALVPARANSRGCPGKNLRTLGGKTLIGHAVGCAKAAGIRHVCVSTDMQHLTADDVGADVLWRGPELAADDTPMLAVVQDFIARMAVMYTATLPAWTGQSAEQTLAEQVIVLLQPTQPFRRPEHVQQAIALLQESGADSVVSVVALPASHHPTFVCVPDEHGRLVGYVDIWQPPARRGVSYFPTRRQDVHPAYIRDGTVYAFRRATVDRYGSIYGEHCLPLIIDPADSCELDTEQDWLEVQRRWAARHG